MRHTYRLIIMNDETFAEVGSYRLTLLNVYVFISTLLVLLALLIVLAIAFTPLKRYIPGYGQGGDSNQRVETLFKEVKKLEKKLEAQQTYTASLRKALAAESETAEDMPQADSTLLDSIKQVGLSEEEKALREEIRLEKMGSAAQIQRTVNFNPGDIPLEQMYFTPPVKGTVSAEFNQEQKHYGVDILAPKNTAIKAAMDGFIFFSDWTLETGNTIGIQHSNNTITFYKHNSALLKKAGSNVKAGEAVAIIGNTGTLSDGPHLHFELWYRGKPVDPKEYIGF
jgi:murein DD-endopeptidase MepM/ murein hydrolase activator NlpD